MLDEVLVKLFIILYCIWNNTPDFFPRIFVIPNVNID